MRRAPVALLVVLVLVIGIGVGLAGGKVFLGSPAASGIAVVTGSPAGATASVSAAPTEAASPSPSDSPSPTPSPTPAPTPVLVADPLDGLMVAPGLAQRHVVAVMIDDLAAARPQSGLGSASIVWQAPAEGGIPRYMALFSEGTATAIGPVRSSRLYFIAWAAEWNAIYTHVGGSPQALALLHSAQGKGSVVYDADEFRWGGTYLWRIKTRQSPHNVYTDTAHLVALTKRLGAKPLVSYPTHWQFAPDAPIDQRPVGGTIAFAYAQNAISYTYDRTTNTYLRTVSAEGKQVDAGSKQPIAPKNVVVMLMAFAPLNDAKHRLEAQVTGSGVAWIATNGLTVKGRWKKASLTAPTLFFGPDGQPVTLTAGQTFVNVLQTGSVVTIKPGSPPPPPSPASSPSGSPSPSDAPSPSPSGSVVRDWRLVA
jgi:hypothetical protein